jgi:transposase
MARPTKYNDTRHKQLVEMIRAGNYVSTACSACGIDDRTFYLWQSKAKEYQLYIDSDKPIPSQLASSKVYYQLMLEIKTAESASEAEAVKLIMDAARNSDRNWVAAATWLSRRFKERWRDDTGLAQDSIKLGLQIMERLTSALERPGTSTTVIDQPDVPALPSPRS